MRLLRGYYTVMSPDWLPYLNIYLAAYLVFFIGSMEIRSVSVVILRNYQQRESTGKNAAISYKNH